VSYNRNQLAVDMNKRLDLPVSRALSIVDTILECVTEALGKGRRVEFRNFGVLEVVTRKPKVGRNPQRPNAAQYHIPARQAVRFRTGKLLAARLND
jgi:nucleoid DNA-binding protein